MIFKDLKGKGRNRKINFVMNSLNCSKLKMNFCEKELLCSVKKLNIFDNYL